jgi:GT2 family glycosyltransferase
LGNVLIMLGEPLVSIGLVTWNSADDLPACVQAIQDQTYSSIELIVVDNASNDASLGCLATAAIFPRIIKNLSNYGFARAHNQAIAVAQGKYYLALNPDVVMEPNYVSILVGALERYSDCGMAGGKLLIDSKRIDSTGLFLDRKRRQYLRGHQELDSGQYDQSGEVFGIDGAAPLYRRTMIDDVAENSRFFDELFVTYKEDVDVAWRARWLGWRAWYTPAAQAQHRRTFRPGQRQRGNRDTRRNSVRNRYLTLLKNETWDGWRRDWLHILTYDAGILGYLLLVEQASLAAFIDVCRLWPPIQRKHLLLMSRKRVAAAELLQWFK